MVILMPLWSYDRVGRPHMSKDPQTTVRAASAHLFGNDTLQELEVGSEEWFRAPNFTLITRPSAAHSRLIGVQIKHTTQIDAAGGPLILKAAFIGM